MAAQTRHVTESSYSTCENLVAMSSATHYHLHTLVTLPLHGLQLLICRVRTPAYIAAGHHIWWSFPYPPPGDAVGSLQLGTNSCYHRPSYQSSSETASATMNVSQPKFPTAQYSVHSCQTIEDNAIPACQLLLDQMLKWAKLG